MVKGILRERVALCGGRGCRSVRPVLAEAGWTQSRQQHHNTVAIAETALRQDRRLRPAGRPAELCALAQIRRRRQRPAVRRDQHPAGPQRHAERRRHRRTARRPYRARSRSQDGDPTGSARAWPARSTRSLAALESRGGQRQPLFARSRQRVAQRLASTVNRADVRAIVDSLAQPPRRAWRRRTRRLQTQTAGDVGGDRAASPRDRRPAHRKPDRSPHRARQPRAIFITALRARDRRVPCHRRAADAADRRRRPHQGDQRELRQHRRRPRAALHRHGDQGSDHRTRRRRALLGDDAFAVILPTDQPAAGGQASPSSFAMRS